MVGKFFVLHNIDPGKSKLEMYFLFPEKPRDHAKVVFVGSRSHFAAGTVVAASSKIAVRL